MDEGEKTPQLCSLRAQEDKDKDKAKHAQSCLSMENQDQDLMNSVLGKGRLDPAQSWISGACLGELL